MLQEFFDMLNPWHGISEKSENIIKECDKIKKQLDVDNLTDIEEIKVYGPHVIVKKKSK